MKEIECPQCGKKTIYSKDNEFRPFCSERCQLVDLGAWIEEEYRVPSEENPSNLDLDIGENSEDDPSRSKLLH